MEKLINPYDKEYMKMAMLKHEETFRNQVYELHRLYEIQKMLMKNTPSSSRSNGRNTEKWNTKNEISCNQIHNQNPRLLDLERPAEDAESDADKVLEIEDESEIELTLGPPNYYSRRKVQTPLTSDSGPCFSSSSGSNYIKRTYARREELYRQKWRLEQMPHDTSPGFLSGGKSSSDVEDQLRQDMNQPAWIFQVLNLNMT